MAPAWPCYRLVLEHVCSWSDIRGMTIDEVDLLCMALDEWQDAPRRGGRGKKVGADGAPDWAKDPRDRRLQAMT